MPTRNMILGTIAAVLAGCSGQADGTGAVADDKDPTLFMAIGGCGYPQYGCSTGNGTGVYYQEGGSAGMDTLRFMITNFINTTTAAGYQQVQVQGRYSFPNSNFWQMLLHPGFVPTAIYNGATCGVLAVSESGTTPAFSLNCPSGPVTVSGPQLWGMSLNIIFADAAGQRHPYQLWFGQEQTEAGNSPSPFYQTTIHKYVMWYRSTINGGGTWAQYCFDANGNSDPVVFQGNMFVAPTSGQVFRNTSEVTLSCRLGAIATVYYWGYDYNVDQWHYAAGIHMKRASYCGDANYYTVSGTQFMPQDDEGVQQYRFADSAIEASWTPSGASCYTQPRRTTGITPFNGYCNGQLLPTCASIGQTPSALWSWDNPPAFLIDGVVAGQ
jgi:hypothetical protein